MPFEFKLGEHVMMIGEKGSGKTTLMYNLVRGTEAKHYWILCGKVEEVEDWTTLVGKKHVLFHRTPEEMLSNLQRINYDPKSYRESLILIDDFQAFYDNGKGELPQALRDRILLGRRQHSSILLGVHYVSRIPPIMRTEIDHIFLFRPNWLTKPHLKRTFDSDELMMKVEDLKAFHAIYIRQQAKDLEIMGPSRVIPPGRKPQVPPQRQEPLGKK